MTGATPPQPAVRVGGWVIAAAFSGTVLIGVGAFWLSFTALADLARRSGVDVSLAWIWPLIVDGVIVVATISVVALSRHGKGATRYAWLLLAGGAAVSVSANITHAAVTASAEVPGSLAAMVASIPPIVLLAITHLTVLLTRYRQKPTYPAVDDGQPETAVRLMAASTTGTRAPKSLEALGTASRPMRVSRSSADAGTADREKAKELHALGRSNRSIATELGVHPATVGRWLGRDGNNASSTQSVATSRADDEETDNGTDG